MKGGGRQRVRRRRRAQGIQKPYPGGTRGLMTRRRERRKGESTRSHPITTEPCPEPLGTWCGQTYVFGLRGPPTG